MGQRWQEPKTLLSAQAIDPGSTAYSVAIGAFNMMIGADDFSVPILFQTTGATGAFTITQQVSLDGSNFFDPTNATSVLQGTVLQGNTTLTSNWLVYTAIPAPYIRYKVVSTPAATVTLKAVVTGDRA